MESVKNKKKANDATESIPKAILPDKKTPKFLKKKANNAAESIPKATLSDKKTPTSLKPKPKIGKKPINQKSTQTKEAKNTSQVQPRNEHQNKATEAKRESCNSEKKDGGKNINLPHGNKEKKITNEKPEERRKLDQKAEEDLGGLIFMCNSKTKPDCFRYQVMGVPTNKQELVMAIKPGLKLFLYDFDLRLLYGIYEASSAGGMKLEPAAFGGAFPAQVRFKVHKDCLPLPEAIFKKAMNENYNEKTHKFKTALTIQKVKKLTKLFRPVPRFHSNAQSSVQELQPVPIIFPPPAATTVDEGTRRGQFYRNHYPASEAAGGLVPSEYDGNQLSRRPFSPRNVASPDPLFLSEKEYRSYGLRGERHMLTTAKAPISSTLDAYRTDIDKEQLWRNPASLSGDIRRKESPHLDPLFLSEQEYRTYGLKRELPTAVTPPIESSSIAFDNYPKDPYYPKDQYYPYNYGSSLLEDRYLPLPRTVAPPSEPYSLTAKEAYANDSTYSESGTRNHQGRVVSDEAERLYSSYASHALSDYNQKYHLLGGQPEATSASVSSRYSFTDPNLFYR